MSENPERNSVEAESPSTTTTDATADATVAATVAAPPPSAPAPVEEQPADEEPPPDRFEYNHVYTVAEFRDEGFALHFEKPEEGKPEVAAYLAEREYYDVVDDRKFRLMRQNVAYEDENEGKNRYMDVLPYDDTRVIVKVDGVSDDLYINASDMKNLIDEDLDVPYIATQGPLQDTISAFWDMIVVKKSTLIVMLTRQVERGFAKCAQYWPLEGKDIETPRYRIVFMDKAEDFVPGSFENYHYNVLNKETNEVILNVKHMQFIPWPDHGIPTDLDKIRSGYKALDDYYGYLEDKKDVGPAVVHCSAGIGRTGTFLLAYSVHRLLKAMKDTGVERKFSTHKILFNLRSCRPRQVESFSQYTYGLKIIKKDIDELFPAPVPAPEEPDEGTFHDALD